VENETCRLPAQPPLGAMRTIEVFPALDFESPLWFGHAGDASGWLYVAEQDGDIYTFEDRDDVAAASLFLHVNATLNGEMGLLGLAFHPNYAANGLLYAFYSVGNPVRSRLVEFRRSEADPHQADPASERLLLEVPKPFTNHNGGDIHFGPDGMLYVGFGDGGSAGDPRNNAQDPTTFLGSFIRIDVDRREDPRPYGIPPDNPFVACTPNCGALGAVLPETWAYGLRNPWRWSFDRTTGVLWAGDVGQGAWEEIDQIRPGENYGWRLWEGNHCYDAAACDPAGMTMPVHDYPHADGVAVIGGHVYRGSEFPELWGAYVFGDNNNGRIWALREENGVAREVALLADTSMRISSFGVDEDDRLHIVGYNVRHSLWRLERPLDAPPAVDFPQRLSQTGCFTDTATHTYAPGVVPYGVNSPLWSDGAGKPRAFALPPGERFAYREGMSWEAPVGTVTLKTFTLPDANGAERRVETRLLTRQADGWQGFSYRWNEGQDDAELLPEGRTEAFETPDGLRMWSYPSRAQCDTCHTAAAGNLLGLTTAQLNGDFDYPGGAANQLAALHDAGYVDLPAHPEALPRLARPDDPAAPLEDRARAWLAANCSHCHRPGANGNTRFDARPETPFGQTALCDAVPLQGDLGIADARLLAPGAPERSVLHARMASLGVERMPPLATTVVDPLGEDVLRRWITEMAACPP
jgi:uncharacterized repeat protein (TIGR03806 family)